jgi:DNA repair protein RadC
MGVAADIMRAAGCDELTKDQEQQVLTVWRRLGSNFFKQVPGLGPAQQARMAACLEVARRLNTLPPPAPPVQATLNLNVIECRALRQVSETERQNPKEWLGFVPIHANGHVGKLRIVERGSSGHVTVDPQRLFFEILLSAVPGFILMHNHPQGCLSPSADDLKLTREIKSLATRLRLKFVSHLIVTPNAASTCVTAYER